MVRLIKALFFLILLGAIGLIGYAYLGDLDPRQAEVTQKIILDVD